MSRAGMANLITRVRSLVNDNWRLKQDADTGDGTTKVFWLTEKPEASGGTVSLGGTVQASGYTWDTTYGRLSFTSAPGTSIALAVEYLAADFTDDDIEDALDANVTKVIDLPLTWQTEYIGGTTVYKELQTGLRDFETAESGIDYWCVRRDTTGVDAGTANYTPDYNTGVIRFTADQGGTIDYTLTARSYDVYSAAADMWMRRQAIYSAAYQFSSDGQSMSRNQLYEQAVKMEKQTRSRAGQNKQRGGLQVGSFYLTDFTGGN